MTCEVRSAVGHRDTDVPAQLTGPSSPQRGNETPNQPQNTCRPNQGSPAITCQEARNLVEGSGVLQMLHFQQAFGFIKASEMLISEPTPGMLSISSLQIWTSLSRVNLDETLECEMEAQLCIEKAVDANSGCLVSCSWNTELASTKPSTWTSSADSKLHQQFSGSQGSAL